MAFAQSNAASAGKSVQAESTEPSPNALEAAEADGNLTTGTLSASRISALERLRDDIAERAQEIEKLKKMLEKSDSDLERKQLTEELRTRQEQFANRRQNFLQLLTGISMSVFEETPPPQEISFIDSIKEIFQPLVSKLHDITARSREIDRLRSEVTEKGELAENVEEALTHIEAFQDRVEGGPLKESVEKVHEKLSERLQELQRDRLIIEERLKDMEAADGDIFKTAGDFMREVVGVHLRNLILTVLVVVVAFLILRFSHLRFSQSRRVQKLIDERHWARILNVLLRTMTVLLSLAAGIVMLYLSNDWILIGLFMLVLLGVMWSMKDNIPLHIAEAQLLFNVGAVREGERLHYEGLPWRVEQINYHTRLRNPALEGGVIRVRLRELTSKTSRTYSPHETWFPTAKRDWAILADGTYGRVILQSPEMVIMRIMEASDKTYAVQDFLGLQPLNLSKGFGLYMHFGIDYAHQAEVTTSIPKTLHASIEESFKKEGFGELMEFLLVEFAEAGASSLDLALYAQFKPDAADRYYKMRRMLQRAAVDACNTYGWGIPFTQITVHQADGGEQIAAQDADS